ncbi:MAG: Rpn family recombination-promoting nuclease/putative transposase [Alphaproteobacteria bacterium]|nr:Rpn family recombination-promoting nuclease/putative transposase [Alphaproteobacteria bacterium]
MQPDATYKYLLSSTFMVEDLMHWLVAERHGLHALVEALDFSTLTRVHEQSVTEDGEALRRHANDMVWRVHLRERGGDAEPEAFAPWLYLVVMLEFQSTVDYLMALRIRNYVDRFHIEQWRDRRFRATDRLAPVLPIVLYIGRARWTAAARVIDLVTPQAAGTGHSEAGRTWQADARFAGDGYVLLDSHRVRPEDLPRDNATTRRRCWRGWRIRCPRRCRSWSARCAGGCGRRSCAS